MADIDLQGTDASYSFGDGAIFQRVDPTLSGTGLYDPFLTVQDSPTEQGYNTNQLGQLDNVYSSGGSGGRTDAVTLSQIPIKIVDGVAYYEFRVDLNEPNSDPVISLERLELYKSSAPADSSDFQGTSAADAFLASDGFTKIFDLDSGGDNRLILSDVTSSGSGRDDYRLLVPVSSFGNIDPTQTYLTMYTDFGQAGSNFDSRATFEEWHTQANATVNGVKFLDSDRDGVKDSGEVGMGGVTVFIDDNRNGVLDLNERSTITASDGTFTFYGVTTTWSDHNVHVAEVVPTGYDRTTGDYEVAAVVNGGISYVEIGNAPQVGSISGTKMADTDNNDTGDTPVAGWTISLYQDDNGNGQIDSGDDLITSTTTAADGSYSFSNLTPGTYIVQEEVQGGWHAITDVTQGATVVSGGDTTVDFVNEQLGSISGTKLADTDNNDTGDTPVNGWGVTLYNDLDHSGTVTAGDTIQATTTTDASGDYSFSGLAPGDYVVEEETRSGWQALTPTDVALTVSAGGNSTADFVNEQLGSISGTKLADTDNNDTGDTPVNGWGVTLYNDLDHSGTVTAGDTIAGTTTTDASGDYSFSDLAPGDYVVEEETRSGWQALTPTDVALTVSAGGNSTADFVNEQLGSISGTKLADTDNNDTGDTPVNGWGVTLYNDLDHSGTVTAGDTIAGTTTTDASGDYSFSDLAPGDYVVEEETRSGWQALTPTDVALTVSAGGTATADFVNEQLGSISGTKLADTDNNDTGDTPVNGWGMTLYNDLDHSGTVTAGDTIAGTTTTDASGDYSFSGLAPGDYVVEEETRTGWQALTPTDVALTVSAGGNATADFVNEQLAALSGYKFSDLNNNGVWDQGSGENGVAGWSIYLYNDNGDGLLGAGDTLADSTTTDSSGYYEFGDLAPGKYIIVEGTQSGWTQTAPNGSDADPESADVNGSGSGYAEYGYAIDLTAGTENEDNNFGNYMIPGPGVRTPGFWGSPNGLTFWDGIVGNEAKSGPNFPSGELAPDGYLILGDDGDGIVETGELKISLTDAHKLIDASNKHGGDAGFMLARDVIATWLNYLAGNPIGSESDTCSPAYWLQEGVDWLIKYENNNHSGASDPLTFSDITSHHVKSTSAAWTVGVSDDGIEAGKDIHSALDEYNNTGMHCGIQYATDADSEFSSLDVLNANSMMAFGHHHAGDYMF